MAQLAVALVGAGVGNLFGQAAIGWSIGSALGGALFPGKLPGVQGPRLNDLKVQQSTYGSMIPIVYGTVRIAGNVIWATDLIERAHTTTSGGKGGPSQSQTTYTYSVSLAVLLCEGPITGVRKIWADGKLIYNAGDDASAETILASNRNAAGITIYPGNETQLPDPLMESHEGVGNVPGYRGRAYVVLDDFQLADYGNRIPNFTFEVLSAATPLGYRRLLAVNDTGVRFRDSGGVNLASPAVLSADGIIRVVTSGNYLGAASALVRLFDMAGNSLGTDSRNATESYPDTSGIVGPDYNHPVGQLAGLPVSSFYSASPIGMPATNLARVAVDLGFGFYNGYNLLNALPPVAVGTYFSALAISADGTHILITTSAVHNTEASAWYLIRFDGASVVSYGTIEAGSGLVSTFPGGALEHPWSLMLESDYKHLWAAFGGGNYFVRCFRIDADNVLRKIGNLESGAGLPLPGNSTAIWADNGVAFAFSSSSFSSFTRIPALTQQGSTLGSIVSNLCARAGLAGGDINVAALTDSVDGYVIANQMSVRRAIEPLQQAYYFDAVESGNVLKFVKRGGAAVASISADDLAAHAYGDTLPDDLPISRQQEVELPASVNVVYINKGADYQQGTQQSKRITVQSQQAQSVEVPIVMADNKARQMADVLIYDAWTQRTRYSPSVSRKHALIEPTDVVTVSRGGATHALRITKKDESRSGVIRLEAVAEQSAVYTQLAPGGAAAAVDASIGLDGPTKLHLLDIPTLRDQDNSAGFYAAARGYTASWGGAVLYKSLDGGASYDEASTFLVTATTGTADGVLANFTGGNIFDEHSTVDVTLLGGTLASTTELAVLNGANAAMLGDELIQYKNAVLIGTRKYRLSGLLRGRKGTEWAMTTHVAAERFVLLESGAMKRIAASNELNLARKYKAVTVGNTLQSTAEQDFTYTGVNLECLAPVLLGGGRASNGDLTINWVRRTRIGGEWNDYVDASLGESSEAYEVEIWNSTFTTLRRTITGLTTPTASYTAAQQVTDAGSNQNPVYVRVYQMSDSVGRGYALQGAI